MKLVFPALEARILNNPTLRRLTGGKLLLALGGVNKHPPYLTVSRVGGKPDPTFAVDQEEYTLVFNGFTSKSDPEEALDFQDALHRAFDASDFGGAGFFVVQMMREVSSGPDLIDGVYQFTSQYFLKIKRTANMPLSRRT